MKVLHIIETGGPGGAEQVLMRTVLKLRDLGVESVVVLLKDAWLANQLRTKMVDVRIMPLHRSYSPKWLYSLYKLIERESISAIHAHEFAMNCHASLVASLTGLPCVTTVHGKNYYADKWTRRFLYRQVSRFSRMVAVSEDIGQHLVDIVGVSSDKVQVINNGVDPLKIDEDTRRRARDALGLSGSDIMVLAVGNLYPVKGHIYILEAAVILRDVGLQGVKFYIAGRGGEQLKLEQYIHQNDLQNEAFLLGYREDVDALLAATDVFTMPSLSEGLPMALLEAMSVAKPVIVSDVGGMPQVVTQEKTGLVCQPRDAQSLAIQLKKMVEKPSYREELAMRGQNYIIENYSLDLMVKGYLELYRSKCVI